MIWIVLAILIGLLHVAAVVVGRRTAGPLERAAFSSGLLGLLSFPVLFFVGLKNICVAGGCGHGQDVGPYVMLGLFLALAFVSAGSVAALAARRSHA